MQRKFLFVALFLQPLILLGVLDQTSLQQMNQLYATAELSFQAGNIQESRELLKKLLELPGYSELNENDRTEITLRLAENDLLLNESRELHLLLDKLFSQPLNDESLVRASLLKAELSKKEGKLDEGFLLLTQLERHVPQAAWPAKGRSLFQELNRSLNQLYQDTLVKGERLFEAGLYAEAAPLFKKTLEAAHMGLFAESLRCEDNKAPLAAKVHYRLAQSYYLAEEYPKAVALLADEKTLPVFAYRCTELDTIICNEIYLLGLSYKNNGQFGEAISSFKRYQKQAPKTSLPQFDSATYEIAL
jgi:tetratricopeptide (TPR) repeat protein